MMLTTGTVNAFSHYYYCYKININDKASLNNFIIHLFIIDSFDLTEL